MPCTTKPKVCHHHHDVIIQCHDVILAAVRRISAVTFGQEYLHGNVQQLQALIELESKSDDRTLRVLRI